MGEFTESVLGSVNTGQYGEREELELPEQLPCAQRREPLLS